MPRTATKKFNGGLIVVTSPLGFRRTVSRSLNRVAAQVGPRRTIAACIRGARKEGVRVRIVNRGVCWTARHGDWREILAIVPPEACPGGG